MNSIFDCNHCFIVYKMANLFVTNSLTESGEETDMDTVIAEGIVPQAVNPLGNYAVQILWEDGFNQVASFDLLATLPRVDPHSHKQKMNSLHVEEVDQTAAMKILGNA